jgi:hypothetical protein
MNQTQIFIRVLQCFFSALFVGTLLLGGYLLVNRERIFGKDADVPGDNTSSRAYNAVQVFVVWAHAAVLTGAFAVGLH